MGSRKPQHEIDRVCVVHKVFLVVYCEVRVQLVQGVHEEVHRLLFTIDVAPKIVSQSIAYSNGVSLSTTKSTSLATHRGP